MVSIISLFLLSSSQTHRHRLINESQIAVTDPLLFNVVENHYRMQMTALASTACPSALDLVCTPGAERKNHFYNFSEEQRVQIQG